MLKILKVPKIFKNNFVNCLTKHTYSSSNRNYKMTHQMTLKASVRTVSKKKKETKSFQDNLINEYLIESLQFEQQYDIELTDINKKISENFDIIDKSENGYVAINLKNQVPNVQKVEVRFHCQNTEDVEKRKLIQYGGDTIPTQPLGEEKYDPFQSYVGIHFIVHIYQSNGLILTFDCLAAEVLYILRMRYSEHTHTQGNLSKGAYNDITEYGIHKNSHYFKSTYRDTKFNLHHIQHTSPVFKYNRMSIKACKAMRKYLESIYINDDVRFFVVAYSRYKEQVQYIKWMEDNLSYIYKTSPQVLKLYQEREKKRQLARAEADREMDVDEMDMDEMDVDEMDTEASEEEIKELERWEEEYNKSRYKEERDNNHK